MKAAHAPRASSRCNAQRRSQARRSRSRLCFDVTPCSSQPLLARLRRSARAAAPIGYDGARHLLNRTGFGATDAEICDVRPARARAGGRSPARGRAHAKPIREAAGIRRRRPSSRTTSSAQMTAEERKAAQRQLVRAGLRAARVVAARDARHAEPAHRAHDALLAQPFRHQPAEGALARSSCTGRTRCCAARRSATSPRCCTRSRKDPAMLVCLDNAGNRKQAPNENFAREVMELFTLGEGHYGERDVKEAARAFTGWSLDRETGKFTVSGRLWHDYGEKTVLGRSRPPRRRRRDRHPPRAPRRPRSSSSPSCGASSSRRSPTRARSSAGPACSAIRATR